MTSISDASVYQELYQRMVGQAVINTHAHHLPDA